MQYVRRLDEARRARTSSFIAAIVFMALGALIMPWGEMAIAEAAAEPSATSGWRWSTTVFFTGLGLLGISQLLAIEVAIREGRMVK